jgi:hypothetical protein
MELLSLEEGGELLLEIVGDHAVLLPVVSIPRRDLPEDLRKKFEARRGTKNSDIPLGEFLGEIGFSPLRQAASEPVAGNVPKKAAARNTAVARVSPAKAR